MELHIGIANRPSMANKGASIIAIVGKWHAVPFDGDMRLNMRLKVDLDTEAGLFMLKRDEINYSDEKPFDCFACMMSSMLKTHLKQHGMGLALCKYLTGVTQSDF